jgi:hypothetical protein
LKHFIHQLKEFGNG